MASCLVEDRADPSAQDAFDLSELVNTLNSGSRRAFSQWIGAKIPADDKCMNIAWAESSGAFKARGVEVGLTKDQKGLVVRLALTDRKTQIEQAKYLAECFQEFAESCGEQIERGQRLIAEISSTGEDEAPFERGGEAYGKHACPGKGKKLKSKAEKM